MESVWLNPDLLRLIVSQSHETQSLFLTTRASYNQEACIREYRDWSVLGCPLTSSPCLIGIGGEFSPFCVGRLFVTVGHQFQFEQEQSLQEIMQRINVILELHRIERGNMSLHISSKQFEIYLVTCSTTGHFRLHVTKEGWKKRGIPCMLRKEQTSLFLQNILNTFGSLVTPCGATSQSYYKLFITRRIKVHVCLEEKVNWPLLTIERK